jgi:hypothetical protein
LSHCICLFAFITSIKGIIIEAVEKADFLPRREQEIERAGVVGR